MYLSAVAYQWRGEMVGAVVGWRGTALAGHETGSGGSSASGFWSSPPQVCNQLLRGHKCKHWPLGAGHPWYATV